MFTRCAEALVGQFPGCDVAGLINFLFDTNWQYSLRCVLIKCYGNTEVVKKDLKGLVDGAEGLVRATETLGDGAKEILARTETPFKSWRKWRMQITGEELNSRDPHGKDWIQGLYALAQEAKAAVLLLEKMTSRGGRRPLGARLEGSSEDWLARTCEEFAEGNGCQSQQVVLKMVQAIQEAEHGKQSMRRKDGKPSKDRGRKAVRKVAQTKPK